MSNKRTVVLIGKIASALVTAAGMQAENMCRQLQGQSMAYDEMGFSDVREAIDDIIAEARK